MHRIANADVVWWAAMVGVPMFLVGLAWWFVRREKPEWDD